MNYQVTSLYFYSIKNLLWVGFCLALSFFGSKAPFAFVLITGVIFPVFISIRLHTLTEQGAVLSNKQAHEWLVYVNGIPVRETRHHLANPFFYSKRRASQFFLRAFLVRAALQTGIIGWMLFEWPSYEMFISYGGVVLALLVMFYSLIRTLCNLYNIYKDRWQVEQFTAPSESEWFRAFVTWRNKRQGALENLLAQF